MTRLFTALILLLTFSFAAQAQEKCLSEIIFQEEAAKNPSLLQDREAFEEYIRNYIQNTPQQRTAGVVRTIPVVVHVIHFGGPENISKEQILNQIDILNQDFRRLNPDTTQTPVDFQQYAADSEIEFALAKLDPNGDCTDGIVRIYNSMTYNARSNVKALSYWPSNQYLNMWIVHTITNSSGSPGQVIGFAQFPGGSPATDGVVIKYDYMGDIGAAGGTNNGGRTATHEVGHWFSLRHIWGDDGGSCAGSDFVIDTPNQADWTLSTCPTTVVTDACTPSAPGIMYSNYMDYTNGDCQNIFTLGQKQRMDATLNASTSGRNNLYSASNLLATGITGGATGECAPVADFTPRPRLICEGSSITFNDDSWKGEVVSRQWSFPGGSPATDTSASPVVTYNTAGTYDVTLTVTNAIGSDTKTVTGAVVVSPQAITNTVPFNEGFESGTWPFADWTVINSNGATSNTWEITALAASQGTQSLLLANFSNNDKGFDEFITPAFNLSNVTNTMMTFDVAYAPGRITPAGTDKLMIYYSTNCGQTWTPRSTITNLQLSTVPDSATNNWIPTSAQWTSKSVNLATTAISTKPNVRFRFEFTHDNGNNLYIDNINLNGTISSIDEINAQSANVNVYPNPSASDTYVDFSMVASGDIRIDVLDAAGRNVSTFTDNLPAGDHKYTIPGELDGGVYIIRLTFGDYSVAKRVVIR
jgi:PKD repeat protein